MSRACLGPTEKWIEQGLAKRAGPGTTGRYRPVTKCVKRDTLRRRESRAARSAGLATSAAVGRPPPNADSRTGDVPVRIVLPDFSFFGRASSHFAKATRPSAGAEGRCFRGPDADLEKEPRRARQVRDTAAHLALENELTRTVAALRSRDRARNRAPRAAQRQCLTSH